MIGAAAVAVLVVIVDAGDMYSSTWQSMVQMGM